MEAGYRRPIVISTIAVFGAWMRQVYGSEGGKIAALILFGGIFVLILIAYLIARIVG